MFVGGESSVGFGSCPKKAGESHREGASAENEESDDDGRGSCTLGAVQARPAPITAVTAVAAVAIVAAGAAFSSDERSRATPESCADRGFSYKRLVAIEVSDRT